MPLYFDPDQLPVLASQTTQANNNATTYNVAYFSYTDGTTVPGNQFGRPKITVGQTNLLQGKHLGFRFFKQINSDGSVDSNGNVFSSAGPMTFLDGDTLTSSSQTVTAGNGLTINNKWGFQLRLWIVE